MGRRGFEYEELPHNWEIIDPNNFTPPQDKAIYQFCGNNANRAEAGNGDAKILRSLLPKQEKAKRHKFTHFIIVESQLNQVDFYCPIMNVRQDCFLKRFLNHICMIKKAT